MLCRKRCRSRGEKGENRYSEYIRNVRRALVKNGGVVLGRGDFPISFVVEKATRRHAEWDVLNCRTTGNGQFISLSLNPEDEEYYFNDVLNVAKPAGPVAHPDTFRTKLLYHSNLPIGGILDITQHVLSFLGEPKEHDWNLTKSIFQLYYDVPTKTERTRKDDKRLCDMIDAGNDPIY